MEDMGDITHTQRSGGVQDIAMNPPSHVEGGSNVTKHGGDPMETLKRQAASLSPQPILEKRPRVEASQAEETEVPACKQYTQMNHYDKRGEELEFRSTEPRFFQGPHSRGPWQSSGQHAYTESIPDVREQSYISKMQHQTRGQSFQGRQQHAPWSQTSSAYDESGYMVGARAQHWQDRPWNVAHHWEADGSVHPSQRAGGWKGEPRISTGSYLSHPTRPPSGVREPRSGDHDGYQVQTLQQRGLYENDGRHGYDQPCIDYNNKHPPAMSFPPILGVEPVISGLYPDDVPSQMLVSTNGTPKYSSLEDSVDTEQVPTSKSVYKREQFHAQHLYEPHEDDRKARGLKPYAIECDKQGVPDESGKTGSKFLEVLKALCSIYLDLSIIQVGSQNREDYSSLREQVESEFQWIGYEISEDGFKKAVSKCMKAERSRLHKLYITNPDRECPPKEDPRVWEKLKTYWKSAEFEKVSKRKNTTREPIQTEGGMQNGTASEDHSVAPGSVFTRPEAVEQKLPTNSAWGVHFGVLISEISTLSANMKALTEALLLNIKQKETTMRSQSKVDVLATPTSHTPKGKIETSYPSGSMNPAMKKNGAQKANGSKGNDTLVLEGVLNNKTTEPSALAKDEDATMLDEGAEGSLSPGSDCKLISPPAKSKKRVVSNVRERVRVKTPRMGLTNPPSKKVRVPRMSVAGIGAAVFKKNVGGGRGKGAPRSSTRRGKPMPKGTWCKGELVDLYHPDDPDSKVAECCTISGIAGEPFHGLNIADGMFKVNVGRILDEDCPLFVTIEDDMPPQLKLMNVHRGMTVWPGSYLRAYEKSVN